MPSTRGAKDACDLLDADHKAVKKMFKEYEELTESKARGASQKKKELAQQICQELTVHAQIEEEIFYPAVREAIKEKDLMDEADVEHQTAKDLIAQIQGGGEPDENVRRQGQGAGRIHRPPREGRAQRDLPQGPRRPQTRPGRHARRDSRRARKS